MKKLLYVGFAVASLFTSCKENVEEWHPNGPQTPPPGQEAVDYGARGYEVFNLVQDIIKPVIYIKKISPFSQETVHILFVAV